jgi:hypothetical protein
MNSYAAAAGAVRHAGPKVTWSVRGQSALVAQRIEHLTTDLSGATDAVARQLTWSDLRQAHR